MQVFALFVGKGYSNREFLKNAMKRAYRYRIYPTEVQKELLAKSFGCSRFVYNHFLDRKKRLWEEKKQHLSYKDCSKALTGLKKEKLWLKEVSSVCLQQSLRHLQSAYEGFFKKRTRFPKFKRRSGAQSCTFMKNAFVYQDQKLTVAKLGALDVRWSRTFTGEPSSLTISKDSAGRYHISLLVDETIQPLPCVKGEIGLDLGITHILIDHQGNRIASPHFLERSLKRLRKQQKSLSRKIKTSNNWRKAKQKLGSLHAKIRDRRLDFHHKLSTRLVHENQVIVAEGLGVKQMLATKKLSRKIGDAGWGILLRLLEYKSQWYGKVFVQIDTYFPSSKQCHTCGHKNENLTLQQRQWRCPSCEQEHDRDINAAKNILREGLRILNHGVPRGTRDFKPVELV